MDTSPSPGRRGNGLPSADWGALVDLDPRLSDALLSSLAAAGVAAYVEPALGSNTFTRAAAMPDRPLDRLWVDPARADAAREVVGAEVADLTTLLAEQEPGATAHGLVQPVPRTAARRVLPPPPLPSRPGPPPLPAEAAPADAAPVDAAPVDAVPTDAAVTDPAPIDASPSDPDEEFRRIVEGFGREADSPVPPWPVSEDIEPGARRRFPGRPARGDNDEPASRSRRRSDEPEEALPDWVEPEALDDDGHYVPPPPPPVPRLAPKKIGAVLAVLLGLGLLFVPSLVDTFQISPTGVFLLAITLVLGGAAALIYLMRDAPPTDSGPDDGAVV